jgi:hypothetical protein
MPQSGKKVGIANVGLMVVMMKLFVFEAWVKKRRYTR